MPSYQREFRIHGNGNFKLPCVSHLFSRLSLIHFAYIWVAPPWSRRSRGRENPMLAKWIELLKKVVNHKCLAPKVCLFSTLLWIYIWRCDSSCVGDLLCNIRMSYYILRQTFSMVSWFCKNMNGFLVICSLRGWSIDLIILLLYLYFY